MGAVNAETEPKLKVNNIRNPGCFRKHYNVFVMEVLYVHGAEEIRTEYHCVSPIPYHVSQLFMQLKISETSQFHISHFFQTVLIL